MTSGAWSYAAPLGRLLLTSIFLMSGADKLMNWQATGDEMTKEGLLAVQVLLPLVVLLELGGALLVLVGFYARLGALALLVFLVPVTLIMHDFWTYENQERMQQMMHFAKNITIMGGILMVLACGPGPISFDSRRKRRLGAV